MVNIQNKLKQDATSMLLHGIIGWTENEQKYFKKKRHNGHECREAIPETVNCYNAPCASGSIVHIKMSTQCREYRCKMVKFRWIFLASYGESSGGQGLVPRSRMGVDGPSSATEKHLSGSHNVDVTVAPERVRFNIF